MDENDINGKIQLKQKEISIEKDPEKKSRLQQELQILNFRNQIDFYRNKITQIRSRLR